MVRIRNCAAAAAASVFLFVAGCSVVVPDRDDSAPANGSRNSAGGPEWTAGIIDRPRSEVPVATLVAVLTDTQDDFDRVVFEFEERIPGYHTEYIDQPVRKCGSGKVTQVAGDGWLEVRLYPANAHTEKGRPTVAERERTLNLPVLSELELTCDFEAVVTWVVGVESPNRYQVRKLGSPPRLVVRVRH